MCIYLGFRGSYSWYETAQELLIGSRGTPRWTWEIPRLLLVHARDVENKSQAKEGKNRTGRNKNLLPPGTMMVLSQAEWNLGFLGISVVVLVRKWRLE